METKSEIMTSELTAAHVDQPKATRWILGGVLVLGLVGATLFVRHKKAVGRQRRSRRQRVRRRAPDPGS